MSTYTLDSMPGTMLRATGWTTITSGFAAIGGIAFIGTGTGGVQFFAGTTGSASLTPMITFSVTGSAVAGGFSPMYLKFPLMVSGSGFSANVLATADPNLMLFWVPVQTT